ncbi:MAG TPA: NusG domain II-containing protein [Clostridia bacterium]|jgi:hypothetical protein|nr:MAG: hypothetical protein BWX97_00161 [Firmicutes bacterium ADurb.Bin146]HOD92369.1 NusG domain II-containing protein [Clostridia bacterium]HQM38634.1 NusG domain II-containing protein [Clostridia bacterium]
MKKADVLLISILICIFLILIGIFLFSDSENGDILVIQQNQKVIYKDSIHKDSEIYIMDASGNVINIVTVKNGTAYMSFADCANKDCIHMGELTTGSKKQISCLPNRVLIYLVSKNSNVDGITK